MRNAGSPAELERRRRLAVQRVLDGYSSAEVADFLGVHVRSVRRWVRTFHRDGWSGLAAEPPRGRPQKLTRTQEKIILRWLQDPATEFGFATELWSAGRIAELIVTEFGIALNKRYLPDWLKVRGFSCQKPVRVPRERNQDAIDAWVQTDWARIKKSADGTCGRDFYR
jgi:transposase